MNKKIKWGAIIGTTSILAGIGTIFGIGYMSRGMGTHDVVITEKEITSLNYLNGTSVVTKKLGATIEGLIAPRNNDIRSQNILDVNNWDGAEGFAKHGNIMNANEDLMLNDYNQNFDTNFSTIRDSFTEGTEYVSSTDSNYKLAAAEESWRNITKDSYRFYLRDTKWSSGNVVVPSDFSFGLMLSLNPKTASGTGYIPGDFSGVKGVSTYIEAMSDNPEPSIGDMRESWVNIAWNMDDGTPPRQISEYGVIYSNSEGYIQYNLDNENSSFISTLAWPVYWPVDEKFFIEGNYVAKEYGLDGDSLSVNGGFMVDEWKHGYGLSFKTNPNYWAKDALMIDSFIFRFVDEASTQAVMFSNGESSMLTSSDPSTASIIEKPSIKRYIPTTTSAPEVKYLAFNTDDNHNRPAAKYYKSKNFRQAIKYAFDRTIALNLEGKSASAPTGTYTARGMDQYSVNGYDINSDWVDFSKDFKYTAHKDLANESNLGYYSSKDRDDMLARTAEEINDSKNAAEGWFRGEDPRKDLDVARAYFSDFEKEMQELGVTVPSVIELDYSTKFAQSDWISKAFQESINEAFNGRIKLNIDYVQEADFKTRFRSGDYDLLYNQWYPDFASPWAFTSINNTSDNSRSGNMTGGWNLWTGSQYTYGDTYMDSYENISSITKDTGLFGVQEDPIEFNRLFGAAEIQFSGIGGKSFRELIDSFKLVDKDGNLLKGDSGAQFTIVDHAGDLSYKDKELQGAQTSDIVNLPDADRVKVTMMLELIALEGAAIIPISNEFKTTNPSRIGLYSEATAIGFPSFTYMWDLEKGPKWAPKPEDVI